MSRARSSRLGRNHPCPCGSGKKFKHCCQDKKPAPQPTRPARPVGAYAAALERQRLRQQGLGRPIVATERNGERFIAVGLRVFRSKEWKTFHDFLFFYVQFLLQDPTWEAERKLPREKRHLLLNWADDVRDYLAKWQGPGGAPMTSLPATYLGLAYSLYVVAHNQKVHDLLLHRLKHRDQFLGAYYEAFVAAAMIRAGFDLALEDETDSSTSHCEFTATYRRTGQKYSVEAKFRRSQKTPPEIGDQLYKALKKKAAHPRLIFVELNVQVEAKDAETLLNSVVANARAREDKITIDGQPAPPAYVVLTNQPPGTTATPHIFCGLVDGFKMADFRHGESPGMLEQALAWRERHRPVLELKESLAKHIHVPSTFDGDIPQFAFTDAGRTRLSIGRRYTIPGEHGQVTGELTAATVMEGTRTAMCAIKQDSGESVMVGLPLSDAEMEAYAASPETFFGVITGPEGPVDHPFKFFDWIYESYKHNSKEHFLTKLLHDAPDLERLQSLSQEELAKVFAERMTAGMIQRAASFREQKQS